MKCLLNGEPTEFPDDINLLQVISTAVGNQLSGDGTVDGLTLGVAVAMDGHVVPRSAWKSTTIHEGAVIELVEAVQGG